MPTLSKTNGGVIRCGLHSFIRTVIYKSSVVIMNLLSTAGAVVHQPSRKAFNPLAGAAMMLLS